MTSSAPLPASVASDLIVGGTAMVLEDSALLAMDAEEILLDISFTAEEVVGTSAAALDTLTRIDGKFAFALLDINLGDHTSLPVTEKLLRLDIPFAFATGDGNSVNVSPEMVAVAVTVIRKPYRPADIAGLVGPTLSSR